MMRIDDPPSRFASKEDEVSFWREMADRMYDRAKEVERELEEFQESSMCLELELETSFQQTERRNRNLCAENARLAAENDEMKARLGQQVADNCALRAQLQEARESCEKLRENVRNLERVNEVLERATRETKMSEEEKDSKLDTLLEKLALMETDLEEKDSMKVKLQRLKDENSDLKHHIIVERRRSQALAEQNNSIFEQPADNGCSLRERTENEWSNCLITSPERLKRLQRELEGLDKSKRMSELTEADQDHHQPQRAKSDAGDEVKLRVRSANAQKYMTLGATSRPASCSIHQEDRDRMSLGVARQIDKRGKKRKEEEEKQQSVSSWLKKFRDSQTSWFRRK